MKLYGDIDPQDIPANEKRAIEFLDWVIEERRVEGHRIEEQPGRFVIHWDDCPQELSHGRPVRLIVHTEKMLDVRYGQGSEHSNRHNEVLVQAESDSGVARWMSVVASSHREHLFPVGDCAISFLLLVLSCQEMFLSTFGPQLENLFR